MKRLFLILTALVALNAFADDNVTEMAVQPDVDRYVILKIYKSSVDNK